MVLIESELKIFLSFEYAFNRVNRVVPLVLVLLRKNTSFKVTTENQVFIDFICAAKLRVGPVLKKIVCSLGRGGTPYRKDGPTSQH